jgi:RNA polymerase sigma-70 factor (ECF subfamily)
MNEISMMSAFGPPEHPVDARLEQFVAGDLTAFESIFREYQGDVYRCIVRIVRDSAAAEDLTLDTFWRIWKARARFDPHRSFGAWARRIASNLALDYLKQQVRIAPLRVEPPAETPPDSALTRETREKIQSAFRQLPPKLQVAATLALIEQDPYDEIAETLGLSVNGVKSRVFRAVRMLRKKLTRMGIEP